MELTQIIYLAVVLVIFVAAMAEKKNPPKKPCAGGLAK